MENKELENAINELNRIKSILLIEYREDVNKIINNNLKSEEYIESTLDRLVSFYDDEDFMELFWKLINYVETFDTGIGCFYRRVEELLTEGP